MHEHIQKPLAQFNAGVITKLELIDSIRYTLEFECGRTNYKNLVEGLPHHVFVVIHNDVG